MAKVFADSLRIQILAELNMREMSPKQFFEEFGGGSIPRVSRAFEVLGRIWLADLGEN
jgi:DNA-binding transcriptional ArsR family regulator